MNERRKFQYGPEIPPARTAEALPRSIHALPVITPGIEE